MTVEPPDWAINPPAATGGVHGTPAQLSAWNAIPQNQMDQMRGQLLESILAAVTQALTGLFLPGPFGAAFEQLKNWADNIGDDLAALPGIGPFIEWVAMLFGLDIGAPGPPAIVINVEKAFREFVRTVVDPLFGGIVWPWQMAPISLGNVTPELPNMVFDVPFTYPPDTTGPTGGWYYRADRGHTKPGSAWLDGDGAGHELVAQPIQVAVGQSYEPSVWLAWESASSATNAVELVVIEYGVEPSATPFRTATKMIASATPLGTRTFGRIFGTYTVPKGVGMVGLGVRVKAGFIGGSLGVDDLSGPAIGLLQKVYTENLQPNLTNLGMMLGIPDADLDGDVDFEDAWAAWGVKPNLPPMPELKVIAEKTVKDFLQGVAKSLGIQDVDLDGDIDFDDLWQALSHAWPTMDGLKVLVDRTVKDVIEAVLKLFGITDEDFDGDIDIDDLWLAVSHLWPNMDGLKVGADRVVKDVTEGTLKMFGVEDSDFDGDVDFNDVWTQWQSHPELPPFLQLPLDAAGNTVSHLLGGLTAAFGLTPSGGPNSTNDEVIASAIHTAELAQDANDGSITAQNAASDAQKTADTYIPSTVDTNKFTATADHTALDSGDWTSITSYGGSPDIQQRIVGGLPMMGLNDAVSGRGDTEHNTALPPAGIPTGMSTLNYHRYYSTKWVGTFLTTTGYGQYSEMVLGGDGKYASTFLVSHAATDLSSGMYLQANATGLTLGTYTRSSNVYSNATGSPLKTWTGALSAGMRVGVFNDPAQPRLFHITVNGHEVDSYDDTGSRVAFDSSHLWGGILMSRAWVVWDAGWPWETHAFRDSFNPTQVLFADYHPPATVGIVGTRHRGTASTTGAALTSGGWHVFAAGIFNTITPQFDGDPLEPGGGMTWDSTNGGYVVPVDGPYMWHMRFTLDNPQDPANYWNCGVFLKNASTTGTVPISAGPGWTQAATISSANVYIGASGFVYCKKNDIVRPGYYVDGGGNVLGSSTDLTACFFNLAKIG